MNLAFVFHLYQPPTQKKSVLKQIVESCYIPLIKSIKNSKHLKATLDVPLSLTYQLEAAGYTDLLSSIKDLYENEKVELVSSAAYHPLLTKLPDSLVEREIVMDEFSMAHYFGKNKGFEGEEAMLIKDLNGFFPPELAVNLELVKLINDLEYKWILVDEIALPKDTNPLDVVHELPEMDLQVVSRNRQVSNLISFKRDTNIDDILGSILSIKEKNKDLVIALDGETFGHHYKEGIYLLETLVDALAKSGINILTVSELVERSVAKPLSTLIESTWSSTRDDIDSGEPYPMWQHKSNQLQKVEWELHDAVAKSFSEKVPDFTSEALAELETLPVWNPVALEKITDIPLKNHVYKNLLLLQCLSSDLFWWSSGETIMGKKLFSPELITSSLELYKNYAITTEDDSLISRVNTLCADIDKEVSLIS
ncbi:hypothetical protein KAZ57_00270 [Patescibacteria group bacterium]|nr:hypothetical protein [Patescibacteria group bacterium]